MTDPTKIPTLEDIEDSKKAMDDIQSFTYSPADTFVDAKGTTRQTLESTGKTQGVIVFTTYALLDAYTPSNPVEEKTSFKVTNDGDSALNGYYSWVNGTTYTKDADLVQNTIDKNNTSDAVSGAAVHNEVVSIKHLPAKDFSLPFYHELSNSTAVTLGAVGFSWELFEHSQSGYKLAKDNATNEGHATVYPVPYNGTDKEIFFTMYFNPEIYVSPVSTFMQFNLKYIYEGGVQDPTNISKMYVVNDTLRLVGDELVDGDGYIKITKAVEYAGTTYHKAVYRFDLDVLGLVGKSGVIEIHHVSRGSTIIEHEFFDIYASDNLESIDKEFYSSDYAENRHLAIVDTTLNLANASMRGDYCSLSVDDLLSAKVDMGCCAVERTGSNGYEDTLYGLVDSNVVGYGIETPPGVNLFLYASDEYAITFGFWLNKTMLLGNDLSITHAGGGIQVIPHENLVRGVRTPVFRLLTEFNVIAEVISDSGDTLIYIQFTTIPDTVGTTSLKYRLSTDVAAQLQMFNLSSNVGKVDFNPFIEYPTLYKKFNSNLVGKTMVVLGDSNGGGGYGTGNISKRFSVAGRLLGLKLIDASKGGWAMQARMVSSPASSGWLYYHTYRDLIMAVKADIYYFNKCTNDGNQGAYAEGTGGATYGSGQWSDIKNVIDRYDILEPYLTADDADGIIDDDGNDISARDYAKKYFTTAGCMGAFIIEVSKRYPEAISVIDTTIHSIGIVNYLLPSEGIIEEDTNGYVIRPPFLLADVVDGMPTSYIADGTQTGGTEDTVTGGSTLIDGNNYNLYKFYAIDLYAKTVGVDSITEAESIIIATACHTYYKTETGTYGRVTPELTDNFNYSPLVETGYRYNERKDYLESVTSLTNWLITPVLDPQSLTGINYWNAINIASDAGHFNEKGHFMLGKGVASSLKQIGRFEDDDYLSDSGLYP